MGQVADLPLHSSFWQVGNLPHGTSARKEAMNQDESPITRRRMMGDATRFVALGGIGSLSGWLFYKRSQAAAACPSPDATCSECSQAAGCRLPQVWQLDPNLCIECGRCQTNCVLDLSAVKAVNCFAMCGYCDKCTGYFPDDEITCRKRGPRINSARPGPSPARTSTGRPDVRYFEYTIDEGLCIACGKCVHGCKLQNGRSTCRSATTAV